MMPIPRLLGLHSKLFPKLSLLITAVATLALNLVVNFKLPLSPRLLQAGIAAKQASRQASPPSRQRGVRRARQPRQASHQHQSRIITAGSAT